MTTSCKSGFTLIELSIVLVIIGLLVGGVLVGRDLISSAAIRSQVSQIEKYTTAVNTFKLKHEHLPGDLPPSVASAFGFKTRTGVAGRGDANGYLQGGSSGGLAYGHGENIMFWEDLSSANLIANSFNTYNDGAFLAATPASSFPKYFPEAAVGGGNFVEVWGGNFTGAGGISNLASNNYFAIAIPSSTSALWANPGNYTGVTAAQGYAIDSKIDDGLPQTGKIVTLHPNTASSGNYAYWSAAARTDMATNVGLNLSDWVNRTQVNPYTSATASSATSCFDNGGVAGATQKYSVGTNGLNCALSFKF